MMNKCLSLIGQELDKRLEDDVIYRVTIENSNLVIDVPKGKPIEPKTYYLKGFALKDGLDWAAYLMTK